MRKLALLLLVAPLALVACGGGSSNQVKVDPVAYVKHAASKTAALDSEHMVLTGTLKSPGAPDALDIHGTGDFSNNPAKGSLVLNLVLTGTGSPKPPVTVKEVTDGLTVYVDSPDISKNLPMGKTWVKVDLAQIGKATGNDFSSMMSQSPSQVFAKLAVAGDAKSVGIETIDGVAATHYQLTNLDTSKLHLSASAKELNPTYGTVDVWIGKRDGYVYRVSMPVSFTKFGQPVSLTMTLEFSKFNDPVTVTVPPAGQVLDVTRLAGSGSGG